jgi:hypothetical protein
MSNPIVLLLLAAATPLVNCAAAQSTAPPPVPVPIDIARAPAPLFDDPVWHGATDPFVIWNPVKKQWFMYYTQRRATLQNPKGVDWVHGSAIGIAVSGDGRAWEYLGTCKGDHGLTDPLKAAGNGPEPGITWWAPCFLCQNNVFHMWVSLVDGIYTNWTGSRNIVHFTSEDGIDWKYSDTCQLSSNRVIDPTVYRVGDTWYMVYKDEANHSRTYRSESKDLIDWTHAAAVGPDGSQEAPFVFHWKNAWWLIVDAVSNRGLRIYRSETGIDNFVLNNTVLAAADGTRPRDNNIGHHPGIVLQGGPNHDEQCLVFYFTHQGNQTVIQLAELELAPDGKVICNRNKYAAPATPPPNP